MIIIISGAGYSGKTWLAQKLLELYKFPYISVDHIKMGLIRGTDCSFSATDNDEMIIPYLWPVIEGIILTNIENKKNLVVEGCYMPQDKVSRLQKQFPNEVLVVYIIFSDDYIKNHFQSDILGNRNVIEQRGYADETDIMEYTKEHIKNKRLCNKYGLPFVEITNDYSSEIQAVFTSLQKQIKSIENEATNGLHFAVEKEPSPDTIEQLVSMIQAYAGEYFTDDFADSVRVDAPYQRLCYLKNGGELVSGIMFTCLDGCPHITVMVTKKDCKNIGYGKHLMEHFVDYVSQLGFHDIELCAWSEKTKPVCVSTQAFYKSMGFTVEKEHLGLWARDMITVKMKKSW